MTRYLVRVIGWLAPRDKHDWALAMQGEIASIPDTREAFVYALGCVWAALVLRVHAAAKDHMAAPSSSRALPSHPWFMQVNCGLAAAAIGVLYLVVAKAPNALVMVNAMASMIGALVLFASTAERSLSPRAITGASLSIAVLLLATAVCGSSVEGASRWVKIGPLFVQSSLVFLPLAVVLFARASNGGTTVAMIASAIAVALQPDRAMASALCAGLLALLVVRRTPAVGIATGAAALAVLVTCLRDDRLPAVPYVDHILWSSFAVHPLLGAALWVGSGLMFLPMLVARSTRALPERLAFAVCWAAIGGSAAVGAYPTPLVGYGGAAILGYFLSLAAVGARTADAQSPARSAASLGEPESNGSRDHSTLSRTRAHRGAVVVADSRASRDAVLPA